MQGHLSCWPLKKQKCPFDHFLKHNAFSENKFPMQNFVKIPSVQPVGAVSQEKSLIVRITLHRLFCVKSTKMAVCKVTPWKIIGVPVSLRIILLTKRNVQVNTGTSGRV